MTDPSGVFCNGFPKSGSHALWRACELLGIPGGVNHSTYAEGEPAGTTHRVLIVRDPRNIIVSWLRFNRMPVTPGTFLAAFRRFQGAPLVEEMAAFEPWLFVSHVVRFERLLADDTAMRGIANYCGVDYIAGAWEELPGYTKTYNAEHSDFRTVWNGDIESAWNGEGGPELLARWGY